MCDSELQETFLGIINNPEIQITYRIDDEEVTAEEFHKRMFPQPKVTTLFTDFRYDVWDNDHEETIYTNQIKEQYKYSERKKMI